MGIVFLADEFPRNLADTEAVTFPCDCRNAFDLRGNLIRNLYHVFEPVGVLLKAQSLDMLLIVGIAIEEGHRADLVESFHQKSFRIEIGKAQRADDFLHAVCPSEVLHGGDQGTGHFGVVDGVEPAETNLVMLPGLVGLVIDYCCYASGRNPVQKGHIQLEFAESRSGIGSGIEGSHLIENDLGNVVRIVPVKPLGKEDKLPEGLTSGYLFDFQRHMNKGLV